MNESSSNTDEINLKKLTNFLKEKSRFIFTFTSLTLLIGIVYIAFESNRPREYYITMSFLKPDEIYINSLNNLLTLNETPDTIYAKFLNTLSNKSSQTEIFHQGKFFDKFFDTNLPIEEKEKKITGFIDSITISPLNIGKNSRFDTDSNYHQSTKIELPYILSFKGGNPNLRIEFLEYLSLETDKKIMRNVIDLGLLKLSSRIERIKERDAERLLHLNQRIESLRYQAKNERLNEIQILTEAAKLAGSLGIIENNLGQINESNNNNLNIVMNEDGDLLEWYLFGEKALLERVEILKSRTSDDPFIPELVSVKSQINEIQNNHLLKMLEEKMDNIVLNFDFEKSNLQSLDSDGKKTYSIKIHQYPTAYVNNSANNFLIIALALFGGLLMSMFVTLFWYFLKEEN